MASVSVQFASPWYLALLPLAALPLLRPMARAVDAAWLPLLPKDPLSVALAAALRLTGALALALTVVALAQPYRAEAMVDRIGRGAEIVVLLDRSRSMDDPFGTAPFMPGFAGPPRETKGRAARRVLGEFAQGRINDVFGLVVFSTHPIRVLDFTGKPEVVQAAIAAGEIGRGLAETDIGRGLLTALDYFADRPYNGSRVVLLVSDGGAHLDPPTQERIRRAVSRYRVALYWLYLRSFRSPGLAPDPRGAAPEDETVPERALNEFFTTLGTTYRAYEAENPEAVQRAIEDMNRLETRPMRYAEVVPREAFSGWAYAGACASAALLLALKLLDRSAWR